MRRYQRLVILSAAVAASFCYSCHEAIPKSTASIDEAKKAIAESNHIYFKAFATGDSSLFIDRYAEDCCIMPPNAAAMCGPNAALAFFRIAYDNIGLRNGKFTTTAVYGNGENFVTEEGLWQSFDSNNVQFDNGKFLVLWKKTPKGWKMFRDSFSSNKSPKQEVGSGSPMTDF